MTCSSLNLRFGAAMPDVTELPNDRKYCGFATDNIEGERTMGMHICDREPGHDGPHRCDICPHEWRDPTPAETQQED